ncbi:MAG: hypothetical protein V3V01_03530 [Acidimicrobiales bacterium]
MSITSLLGRSLRENGWVTSPVAESQSKHLSWVPGSRHETMEQAIDFFAERGIALCDFERIFTVMRNPYDLEYSRYSYLRKNYEQDRGPAQDLAMIGDFRSYLPTAPFFGQLPPRLDEYYRLPDGTFPNNSAILPFERLEHSVRTHLGPYLRKGWRLTRENRSTSGGYRDVYDAELEEICYRRNQWFFDEGYFKRLTFS